jgi:hypothetical protein
MNCAQARPLLLDGDPAADVHLEQCAACGAWLEKHDPIVIRLRAARPEALPAPAGLRRRVIGRWAPDRPAWRRWAMPLGIAAATAVLVLAAGFGLMAREAGLVIAAGGYAQPVLVVFAGPRDLLLGNLVGLSGLAGLALLSLAIGGLLYRDLGRASRGLAR